MNETLACYSCGRSLHVPDDLRGQEVKCPACHHTFIAPSLVRSPLKRGRHRRLFAQAPYARPIVSPETALGTAPPQVAACQHLRCADGSLA